MLVALLLGPLELAASIEIPLILVAVSLAALRGLRIGVNTDEVTFTVRNYFLTRSLARTADLRFEPARAFFPLAPWASSRPVVLVRGDDQERGVRITASMGDLKRTRLAFVEFLRANGMTEPRPWSGAHHAEVVKAARGEADLDG